MSYNLNTHFTNPKTEVSENDIKTLTRFVKSKYKVEQVIINIQEVNSHKRMVDTLSHSSLQVFNQIKIHATDYLGRYSLPDVCTPRGDNRIRDIKGKVYYVVESKVEKSDGSATLTLDVISSHNVVSFFERSLSRFFKTETKFPTHMIRTVRQSLVFAKKEDRGELDGDSVDMREE